MAFAHPEAADPIHLHSAPSQSAIRLRRGVTGPVAAARPTDPRGRAPLDSICQGPHRRFMRSMKSMWVYRSAVRTVWNVCEYSK